MSQAGAGEEIEILNTSANAVWQKLWSHNRYIWLFVICCYLPRRGNIAQCWPLVRFPPSVSKRDTRQTSRSWYFVCVCTPSTNVCQINLSWKQYGSYSLGLFRVHSYWHPFAKYSGYGNAAVVECVVGATNFRTRLGPIQLPAVPYRSVGAWKCGRHPLAQQGLVLWSCTCQCIGVSCHVVFHCNGISSSWGYFCVLPKWYHTSF